MRIFDPTRKNAVQLRGAALVLLAVALVIPQLTWADHASDHPYSQFDDLALVSPSEGYAALVEKYETGELVFQTPGRRDDRAFSASADSAQIGAAFLAANPEIVAFRRYVASQQRIAAAASSARWVALGEYYTSRDAASLVANPELMTYRRFVASDQTDAAFLVANPEIMTYRRFVASDQTDAAFLVANPELMTYRRFVASDQTDAVFLVANPEIMTYRRFVQDGCSEPGQVC